MNEIFSDYAMVILVTNTFYSLQQALFSAFGRAQTAGRHDYPCEFRTRHCDVCRPDRPPSRPGEFATSYDVDFVCNYVGCGLCGCYSLFLEVLYRQLVLSLVDLWWQYLRGDIMWCILGTFFPLIGLNRHLCITLYWKVWQDGPDHRGLLRPCVRPSQ
jgi:hypothetical protein